MVVLVVFVVVVVVFLLVAVLSFLLSNLVIKLRRRVISWYLFLWAVATTASVTLYVLAHC